MLTRLSLTLCLVFLAGTSSVRALTPVSQTNDDPLSAFASMKRLTFPAVNLPTVVEIPVSDSFFQLGNFSNYFGIYEETTHSFQPTRLITRSTELPKALPTTTNGTGNPSYLSDNNPNTSVEFPVTHDTTETALITLTATTPVSVNGISFSFDQFVALPQTIEIRSTDGGVDRVVLATTKLPGRIVRFPRITTSSLTVKLGYVQPLRLTEVSLFEENPAVQTDLAIRFLARPLETYTLYFGADRPVFFTTTEAPDLMSDRDVVRQAEFPTEANPSYQIADSDKDGVPDQNDNCINDRNTDQRDENKNGRGDVCDDYDRDGVMNGKDNCPDRPNANQIDTDGDDHGDVCDGEESRLTERFPWVPTALIGLASIVVIALFASMLRHMKKNQL